MGGQGHPFNGGLNLDRPFFLVDLLKASMNCNSGGNQSFEMENIQRPKFKGLGPSVSLMLS
jgi:hypothetical protein